MRIFTKRPPSARMMLANPCHHFAYQWQGNIRINKYAKFDPNDKTQELWGFSLTDHNRLDWCSANPRPSKRWFEMPEHVVREYWHACYICKLWSKYTMWFNTPGRRQSKTPILSRNVDQKSLETVFPIAICRPNDDTWQSKTLYYWFLIRVRRLLITFFDCRLPGVFKSANW